MVLLIAPNVSMVRSSSIFRLAIRFPRFRWSCLKEKRSQRRSTAGGINESTNQNQRMSKKNKKTVTAIAERARASLSLHSPASASANSSDRKDNKEGFDVLYQRRLRSKWRSFTSYFVAFTPQPQNTNHIFVPPVGIGI